MSDPLHDEVALRQGASRRPALPFAARVETSGGYEYDDLVDDVMRRSPPTIRVFLAFRMGCVGCPLACFHTVADACREHHIDRAEFLAALHDCAASSGKIRNRFPEKITFEERAEN